MSKSSALSSFVGTPCAGRFATAERAEHELSYEEEELKWAKEGLADGSLQLKDIVAVSGKSRTYWKGVLGLEPRIARVLVGSELKQEIIRLYRLGNRQSVIARILGVSRTTVCNHVGSYQRELRKLEASKVIASHMDPYFVEQRKAKAKAKAKGSK